MLARKYSYQETAPAPAQEPQQRPRRIRKANYRVFRNRLIASVAVIIAMYGVTVFRSAALVNAGNYLLDLRSQESQLITKNAELKIEVDQLKGPERITSIAEKQLGMSVARSNIYIKSKTANQ